LTIHEIGCNKNQQVIAFLLIVSIAGAEDAAAWIPLQFFFLGKIG